MDLVCSFQFQPAEYKQLDIKWYFDNEVGSDISIIFIVMINMINMILIIINIIMINIDQEEPFLQWVPSAGREPQTIGARFR